MLQKPVNPELRSGTVPIPVAKEERAFSSSRIGYRPPIGSAYQSLYRISILTCQYTSTRCLLDPARRPKSNQRLASRPFKVFQRSFHSQPFTNRLAGVEGDIVRRRDRM